MLKTEQIRTFIGANSVRGYLSHRETLYDPKSMETVLLIKGGAGNGKSTLMSRFAAKAEERGYTVERVFCPSDPKSLDGIVCRELGFAMTDATPPHVWEPDAHCLPERYLSLSPYVSTAVKERKSIITELSAELKSARREADKSIKAAFEADSELTSEVLTFADTGKLAEIGLNFAEKYLPKRTQRLKNSRKMLRRFISALSPNSRANFFSTPYALCGGEAKTIAIDDEFGLSPFLLGSIADEAENCGLEVWGFFDPLVTSRLTGLCIPEEKLCFLPRDGARSEVESVDTSACISMTDREKLGSRPEVLLSVRSALLEDAAEKLGACLTLHDKIEAEYRPYTDFDGLNSLEAELEEKYIPKSRL